MKIYVRLWHRFIIIIIIIIITRNVFMQYLYRK
jgi:hypothetical protein